MLKDKIRDLEDRSRRDNLRFDGVREYENESWNEVLKDFLFENLGLQNIKIERAHRTGERKEDMSRTIVTKFSSYKTKKLILKSSRNLNDTGYHINENVSEETVEIRKENWKKFKELRKNGKYAILVYEKVLWGEKRSSIYIFNLRKHSLNWLWCFERTFVCVWRILFLEENNFDVENENSENILLNPFEPETILSDENNDPDINFFNKKSEVVNSPYYNVDRFNSSSQNLLKNSFSILHINIRSMNKNFEKLHEYLSHVKGNFSIKALTETWCSDDKADKNSLFTQQYIKLGIAVKKEEV